MQTTSIPRSLIQIGTIFVILNAVLVSARSLTEVALFGVASTLLITVFSFYHGFKRYGTAAMVFFAAMITVISWSYETLSILTGFPFGNYHYSDLLPPMIWLVPAIIMPAYFAMGYLSWTIASVLLGKRDSGVAGGELILVPLLSSFVMVMWDICMDPFNSTMSGFWIWHDGGAYFGVPFVNFMGWYLCVFTSYFVFALFLRTTKGGANATTIQTRGFWVLPILMYVSRSIEYWGNMLVRESVEITARDGHVWHSGDITTTLVLMSLFTMVFVSFLGVVLITRSKDLSPAT